MRWLPLTLWVSALALILEAALARARGLQVVRWRDTANNVFIYLVYSVILVFWTASTYFLYDLVYSHALFDLTVEGPLGTKAAWAPWVLLVLLEDACFYAFHRASHGVRLLWTAHQVHHSSSAFNLSTALRQSWLPFLAVPFWLPLPWLGFPPEQVLTVQLASLFFQFFLHTQLVPSFGPLDALFNSPRHHLAHHGLEPQFVDRNFGGVFIFWDRLFGTFVRGRPHCFGVEGDEPLSPLAIELGPWLALLRDVARAPTWASRLWTLFGPPGFTLPKERTAWPARSPSPSP
jgi:sterol desaturase/sphingolipid hydroxylase (fatty acid hydroxylase superfamily)